MALETEVIHNKLNDIRTFKDYIGQEDFKQKLLIAIQAAKERDDPIPSVLIAGFSGIGKSTLANIIANEYGTECKTIMAPSIKTVADILEILVKLEKNTCLFIDEIHRLSTKIEECLYSAIHDFKASIRVAGKNIVHVDINPFCLIGATTDLGLVSEPLRNRFGILHILKDYNNEEIAQIIKNNVKKLDLTIDNTKIYEKIAFLSRGVPRNANRILSRIRDFAQINNNNIVTDEVLEKVMSLEKINSDGLTEVDQKYLYVLYRYFGAQPAGIVAISSAMNVDRAYIEQVVEPFLVKKELIIKSKSGRQLTEKGFKFIK